MIYDNMKVLSKSNKCIPCMNGSTISMVSIYR